MNVSRDRCRASRPSSSRSGFKDSGPGSLTRPNAYHNPPMSTFRGWLTTQMRRSDKIGQFAREMAEDASFPNSGSFQEIAAYLQNHGASEAQLEAFSLAWQAWLQDA